MMLEIILVTLIAQATPVIPNQLPSDETRRQQLKQLCHEYGGTPIYENLRSAEIKPLCRFQEKPRPERYPDPITPQMG